MRLRLQILIIISLVSILATSTALVMSGAISVKQMRADALKRVEADLTSKRVLVASEISNYIQSISSQIVVMANDVSIKEAAEQFTSAFFSLPIQTKEHKELRNYYEYSFQNEFKLKNPNSENMENLFAPLSERSLTFQNKMIANNPFPLGDKDQLTMLNDESEYDSVHTRYHSTVRRFLKAFGYYDIFLVEPEQGHIVYSVFKELDYATSLKTGPYKESGIAQAFNKALTLDNGETHLTDFAPYLPSYNAPASFISTPVYQGEKLLAVLIFQMPIKRINDVMTQQQMWQESGFGDTGEVYLVGSDQTLRNESRLFMEQPKNYLSLVSGHSKDALNNISNKQTTISLQSIHSEAAVSALAGKTGFSQFTGYHGKNVLSSYAPITIGEQQWAILSEINEQEAFKGVEQLLNRLYSATSLIVILVAFFAIIFATYYANFLTSPLIAIARRFGDLNKGHADLKVKIEPSNIAEMQAIGQGFNEFTARLDAVFIEITEVVGKIAVDLNQPENRNIQTYNGKLEHYLKDLKKLVTLKEEQIEQEKQNVLNYAEELKQAKESAEAANVAKSMFLSNMSHEIRTPMNGVLGTLQLLENSIHEPENKKLLEQSLYSARALLTILNDILDYTKIEAGKLSLEKTPFSVKQVVDSIISEFKPFAEAKNLQLYFDYQGELHAQRLGDPVRVRQIILNLLSNAIKFTETGSVTLTISERFSNHWIVFEIADTGIGMDENGVNALFERFEQADNSITRKFGGTGLGMAITKNLVALMHGDIRVSSELGQGTKFTVELPLPQSEIKFKKEKVTFDTPDFSDIKVLVAEDNKVNQAIIKRMLEASNANVIMAEDGQIAVEHFRAQQPDIVLMDINMPNMDGVEACRIIKTEQPSMRLIAVTASIMQQDLKMYTETGFDDCVEKPIDMPTLYTKMMALLQKTNDNE